ncbi:DUF4907 domain-containing protein [Cytophagaceae bacterium ABcell3]|nr:DUF4907 domain-containing protein [Cytophagaceae bacterium ABcell3]
MKYYFILLIFGLLACGEQQEKEVAAVGQQRTAVEQNTVCADSIRTEVFETETGWGYSIFINENKYVHQPHIPAVAGVKGFNSAEAAGKTADLVKSKICQNILPPSVSIEELDSLGVLH